MKLLLDEQIPARFAREFAENYDVTIVQGTGWASTKNGELLESGGAYKNLEFLICNGGAEHTGSIDCI